jgi:hypothetical protein
VSNYPPAGFTQGQPDRRTILYPKFRGELIPFDLQKALSGSPVVTRNGYEVAGLRRFGQELHGVFTDRIAQWEITGRFPDPENDARILDLFIGVPAKATFFTRLADRLEAFFLGADRRTA